MKSWSVSVRMVIVGVLLACVSAASLGAQTYQGALRGAVRDAQGVIPGAEVTLVNEDTNATRSAMSNEVGEYAFGGVLPGTYTVRVSLPGSRPRSGRVFVSARSSRWCSTSLSRSALCPSRSP